MQIPKIAKGGIVNDNSLFNNCFIASEEKRHKELFYDKYYVIYKRTKNRRIKKKQEKKSWRLKFQNSNVAASINNALSNIQSGTIQICIGGRPIGKTFIQKGMIDKYDENT